MTRRADRNRGEEGRRDDGPFARASAALFRDRSTLPPRDSLPRWLAPLPASLENLGLRLVWPVVLINLAGTAFGFWYYRGQFLRTPAEMWPFVPDSPVATLFIAVAFALWALGRSNEYVNALAFFGNVKLGLWTPFVLATFTDGFLRYTAVPLFAFLFVSHLAMVVQALVLHRISDFPVKAVGFALLWYAVDLTVDYFVHVVGGPHHTTLPYPGSAPAYGTTVLQVAAAGAVALTLAPLFWALATRVKKLESRSADA